MPEHIIKYHVTGRHLQFDEQSGRVNLVAAKDATGFPTPEAAWEKVQEAAARLKEKTPNSKWIQVALGDGEGPLPALNDPAVRRCFEALSRPIVQDFAEAMELTYIRSARYGWLCRDTRASGGTRLIWDADFTFAVAFPDPDSARRAVEGWGVQDASLFKTRSVFVAVESQPGAASVADPVRDQIKAAIEAREIGAEIEKASASEAKPKPPGKPRSRKSV